MHNEDNSKSIKLDINDIDAEGEYGSAVNIFLANDDNDATANINAVYGFSHDYRGRSSNLGYDGLYIEEGGNNTQINAN